MAPHLPRGLSPQSARQPAYQHMFVEGDYIAPRPVLANALTRILGAVLLVAVSTALVAVFRLSGDQASSSSSAPIGLDDASAAAVAPETRASITPGPSSNKVHSLLSKSHQEPEALGTSVPATAAVGTTLTTTLASTTTSSPLPYPMPYGYGQWPVSYEYAGGFPEGFIWGMATASYQIEGSYRKDGRGASIWDTFTGADTIGMPGGNCSYCCKKMPCQPSWAMKDKGATGNVAADHYNLYKVDVALMKAMGLKHYRFSFSWSRLIPTGKLKDGKNENAIQFYKGLINELQLAGITPYATIYHWDLPQGLLDPENGLEAWWSRDPEGRPDGKIMPDWLDYANLCFSEFGDRIKFWTTFNEPWTFLFLGSGFGKAPSIKPYLNMSRDPWIGGHNVLNAHAAAVDLYRQKYQKMQKGTIGIVNNADWREPSSAEPQDIWAADRAVLFMMGWFADPIFGETGDYPPEMRLEYGSRLPEFTAEQKALLRGSADFFGFNHYGTGWITYKGDHHPGQDLAHANMTEEHLPNAQSPWLYGAAWGFRKVLNWISRRYNNPPLLVTEGGWSMEASTVDEGVRDLDRIVYYANYTSELRRAVYEDGIDVRGYFAWSLLDNFEWEAGYKERFGTCFTEYNFGVDPKSPEGLGEHPTEGKQLRRRKESSCWLEHLWRSNALQSPYGMNFESCISSREFHGEFKDPTKPECLRLLEVHAPGTRASLFDGCSKAGDDSPSAHATFSGSTIVANFSARGGPERLIGFWSVADSSIVWSDGGVWKKVLAGEIRHSDGALFQR